MPMRNSIINTSLITLGPAIVFLVVWEIVAVVSQRTAFLFGRPSLIGSIFFERMRDGRLPYDFTVTLTETLLGFVLGNAVGVLLGLALWRWTKLDTAVRPYLIALGAVPVFALAPILVIWFGTGLFSKVILVFLSTVVIATFHAHAGAVEIDPDLIKLFRSWRANDVTVFRQLVLPSVSSWMFASLRLNIGLAILGAFIGEFISAEAGLGHRLLIDAGLYNMSALWTGVIAFAAMALGLSYVVNLIERLVIPWRSGMDPWATHRRTKDIPQTGEWT